MLSSRPAPIDLLPWALLALGAPAGAAIPRLSPVAGDASARRYFRFSWQDTYYILAEAPPETEKNEAFIANAALLTRAGVKAPEVFAMDLTRGYLLLEDLGDTMLLDALEGSTVEAHYSAAFAILEKMALVQAPESAVSGLYDEDLLQEELGRFSTWFVSALLQCEMSDEACALLARFEQLLIASALEQPRVLVHRDFHSRNLMLLNDGNLGVIDFQDAVIGPVTYDLVSLLKDCYIRWPADQVDAWALQYRGQLATTGRLSNVSEADFLRWFDWMGLQRHIKVLGTFARLYLRDGKRSYLDDLPLVIDYVCESLNKYAPLEPVFAEFQDWFQSQLSPVIVRQPWSRST